jgi:hypothetical protein
LVRFSGAAPATVGLGVVFGAAVDATVGAGVDSARRALICWPGDLSFPRAAAGELAFADGDGIAAGSTGTFDGTGVGVAVAVGRAVGLVLGTSNRPRRWDGVGITEVDGGVDNGGALASGVADWAGVALPILRDGVAGRGVIVGASTGAVVWAGEIAAVDTGVALAVEVVEVSPV